MLAWLQGHEVLIGWLGAASVLVFIVGILAVPLLVIRIPADYFVHRRHLVDRLAIRHPLLRAALLTVKNIFGLMLVVAGLAMTILPGPGILSIILGLMCLDFPGKFALEQRIARCQPIIGAMNKIRAKAKHPPLELPSP